MTDFETLAQLKEAVDYLLGLHYGPVSDRSYGLIAIQYSEYSGFLNSAEGAGSWAVPGELLTRFQETLEVIENYSGQYNSLEDLLNAKVLTGEDLAVFTAVLNKISDGVNRVSGADAYIYGNILFEGSPDPDILNLQTPNGGLNFFEPDFQENIAGLAEVTRGYSCNATGFDLGNYEINLDGVENVCEVPNEDVRAPNGSAPRPRSTLHPE